MVWRGICVCKNSEGKETIFLLKYAQENPVDKKFKNES